VEYGCEKKVTQFSNLSASIAVGVPSGVTLKLRLLLLRYILVFTCAFSVCISSSHTIFISAWPMVKFQHIGKKFLLSRALIQENICG